MTVKVLLIPTAYMYTMNIIMCVYYIIHIIPVSIFVRVYICNIHEYVLYITGSARA